MYVTTQQAAKVMGLGCACCDAKGMGSIDFSTFSWEDWFIVGIVGTMVLGIVQPSIFVPSKPKTKRKRKPVSAGTGFAGGIISTALLLGGGYLAYQYFSAQGSTG